MSGQHDPVDDRDDLRRALRAGAGAPAPGAAGTHELLTRVRAGARARRRRRTLVRTGAAVTASAALVVGAAVLLPGQPGGSPGPSVATVGSDVAPTDVAVRSITATGPQHVWVAGSGSCDGDPCALLGRSTDAGGSVQWRVAPGRPDPGVVLRLAPDRRTAYLATGDELLSTTDEGASWSGVATPAMTDIRDVVVRGDRVWVVGDGASASGDVVATGEVGADRLDPAVLPARVTGGGDVTETLATTPGGASVLGLVHRSPDGDTTWVRTDDDGASWQLTPMPCDEVTAASASADAVWVSCTLAGQSVLRVSGDGGTTFTDRPLVAGTPGRFGAVEPLPAEGALALAAVTSRRVVVATSTGLLVADAAEPVPATVRPRLDGEPTYLGFTSADVGLLLDSGGGWSRTDDGGTSWQQVPLP